MKKLLELKKYLKEIDAYSFSFNQVLNKLIELKLEIRGYGKTHIDGITKYTFNFKDNSLLEWIIPKNIVKIQKGVVRLKNELL